MQNDYCKEKIEACILMYIHTHRYTYIYIYIYIYYMHILKSMLMCMVDVCTSINMQKTESSTRALSLRSRQSLKAPRVDARSQ